MLKLADTLTEDLGPVRYVSQNSFYGINGYRLDFDVKKGLVRPKNGPFEEIFLLITAT